MMPFVRVSELLHPGLPVCGLYLHTDPTPSPPCAYAGGTERANEAVRERIRYLGRGPVARHVLINSLSRISG